MDRHPRLAIVRMQTTLGPLILWKDLKEKTLKRQRGAGVHFFLTRTVMIGDGTENYVLLSKTLSWLISFSHQSCFTR